jgi:hypothetical protein
MFRATALIAALVLAIQPFASVAADAPPELVITEAENQQLGDFLWLARVLVVFADSPADPRFVRQMEYIRARAQDLVDRDVVVITDTRPSAHTPIREELHPRGFGIVLIGKDGQKYLRKPVPWEVREIAASIDKMPDRAQELKEERSGG